MHICGYCTSYGLRQGKINNDFEMQVTSIPQTTEFRVPFGIKRDRRTKTIKRTVNFNPVNVVNLLVRQSQDKSLPGREPLL